MNITKTIGWCYGLGLSFCLIALGAQAELTVIYDSGQTRPIALLLEPLFSGEAYAAQGKRSVTPSIKQQKNKKPSLGPAEIKNLLPIRSPGLSPGVLTTTPDAEQLNRLAQGNARPFFLIGADALSRQWLQNYHGQLKALGAVGMLVQADTEAEVRRIAELAAGLEITLGSAADIAKALGIDHYPVLITSKGVEQ